MAHDKPEIEKAADSAREKDASDSLRQCVSYGLQDGIKNSDGSYSFGPWTMERVMKDGKELGMRTTDQTFGKVAPGHDVVHYVNKDGNQYFFPEELLQNCD